MKFKSDIEVQAGLKDSSGAIGASGKILSSTGTGVAWVDDNPGVTGTGTTNYIPKFTGSSAIGNSVIYDDGTNIAIGTTTALTGGGTGKWITLQGTAAYSGGIIGAINGVAKMYVYFESGFAKIQGASGEGVRLDVNGGTAALTAFSNGNVGIGTTSPSEKLEVQNGAAGAKIKVSNSGGGYATLECSSNATSVAQLSFTNQLSLIGGNVGIGTTSPSQKLTIGDGTGTGNQYIRIHASASDMYIGQTGSNLFGAGNGQVIVTDVTYTSNLAIGTLNSSANLVFGTASTERMRITSGGNVGIGTTSPTAKLNVSGDIHIGDYGSASSRILDFRTNNSLFTITTDGTSGGLGTTISYSWANGGQGPLKFNNASGEVMRLSSGGNVGIGTANPTSLLHLVKGGGARINLGDSKNTVAISSIEEPSDSAIGFFTQTTTERMRITSGGNVGIGTTSPNRLLTVSGTQGLMSFNATSYRNTTIGSDSVGSFIVYDDTASAYRMVINSSGNVGIGTTSPSVKLHVVSAVGGAGNTLPTNATAIFDQTGNNLISISGGSANEAGIFMPRGTAAYYSGVFRSDTNLLFRNNDSEFMRITSGGNVGIGTTSPSYKTTISSNPRNTDVLCVASDQINSDGAQSYVGISMQDQYANGSGNASAIRSYSNLYSQWGTTLTFSTTAGSGNGVIERMRITSGGNVGIGTTTDNGYKLQVTGGINTTTNSILAGTFSFINLENNSSKLNCSRFLAIQDNGNSVGIGYNSDTTPFGGKLLVNGNAFFNGTVSATSTGGFANATYAVGVRNPIWRFGNADAYGLSYFQGTAGEGGNDTIGLHFGTASSAASQFKFLGNGNCLISGTVTATGFFNSSDIRLKDLTDYDYNVSDIKPITYLWKDGRDNKKHVGYSAQEVQKVMPDAVNEDEDGMLSVNYVEVLVAQVELLNNRMSEMQKEIELLKSK